MKNLGTATASASHKKKLRTSDISITDLQQQQEFQSKECSTPRQTYTQFVKEKLHRFLKDGGQSHNISMVPELEYTPRPEKSSHAKRHAKRYKQSAKAKHMCAHEEN